MAATAERAAAALLPASVAERVLDADYDIPRLVNNLSTFLYNNAIPILRTRSMLCHIFNHALSGRFYEARDLLLLSHLQDAILQADINTQVLYNRTLVQLALCAFRLGMLKDAEACLQDICSSNRVKELLAQGVQYQRFGASNPEQEKLERQRQLPFHLHINLELIECVYLTCAMLAEIPAMAKAGSLPEARKRINSKPFRRLLDYSDRLAFVGRWIEILPWTSHLTLRRILTRLTDIFYRPAREHARSHRGGLQGFAERRMATLPAAYQGH